MQIKICGVRDVKTAAQAVDAGADLIGMIMVEGSPRYVDPNTAKAIAQATADHGGRSVAVFVDANASQIRALIEETNMDIVQLHGTIARQQLTELPANLPKIVAVPVTPAGQPIIDLTAFIPLLDPKQDFILFDNQQPGSGQPYRYDQLPVIEDVPVIIAGGVSADNVAEIVKLGEASMVDVSTRVEDDRGHKSMEKIKAFITAVRKGDD